MSWPTSAATTSPAPAEEADAYFSMLGLDVDPAARDALLRRTQGWMAGLRLAAMRAALTRNRARPSPTWPVTSRS